MGKRNPYEHITIVNTQMVIIGISNSLKYNLLSINLEGGSPQVVQEPSLFLGGQLSRPIEETSPLVFGK